MRALSIMQPWAWLIVHGHKDIENRKWATPVRGPILIHAGRKLDRDAAEDLWAGRHPVTGELLDPALAAAVPRSFATGGIVGEARIVDCVTRHPSRWFVGLHGFVLADARPLPFVPWRGQLGFFDVDLAPAASAPTGQGSLL